MKYGFSKKRFSDYLHKTGIEYFHIPELGIPSHLRQNLNTPDDYRTLFLHYQKTVLQNRHLELDRLKNLLKKYKRVVLTCFENDHTLCHRHKIIEYLSSDPKNDIPVVHL